MLQRVIFPNDKTYVLVEAQGRRVSFKTDVFQRDLLDQFVSLSYRDHNINSLYWTSVPTEARTADSAMKLQLFLIYYIILILALWEYY